jgi:hypothetical protein
MIVKALKAMANALVGKKEEDGPHPLDGPTKRAQVEDKTQHPLPNLNPVDAGWPFPTARPDEGPQKAVSKPAKKTPKQIAAEKRKAAADADRARAKKTKKK